MFKSFFPKAPRNSSENKILTKKGNTAKDNNVEIIDGRQAVQAKIVLATKQHKPIEDIEKLLQPYLPSDVLVLSAINCAIDNNRPIEEVKTLLKLSVTENNLVINKAINDLVKLNRAKEDIKELESYKKELNDYILEKKIKFYSTSIKNAAQNGNIEKLKKFLDMKEAININNNESPLMLAAQNGQVEAVKLLLEHGSNTNVQGWAQKNLLDDISIQVDIISKIWGKISDVNVSLQDQPKYTKAELYPIYNTTISSKYTKYRDISEKEMSQIFLKLLEQLKQDLQNFTEIKDLLEIYSSKE